MKTSISVIIPTFNRLAHLRACLGGLARQTIKNFEVIVVNDGGEAVEALTNLFADRLNIRAVQQANAGPAKARNTGARYASGKVLAFIDDDCLPFENWIAEIIKLPNSDYIIGGHVENRNPENIYSVCNQTLLNFLYQYNQNKPDLFFTSNNLIVPKRLFETLDGFDIKFRTSAGEDREFCVRATALRVPLLYKDQIKVWHNHYQGFSQFWSMHKKYGAAAKTFQLIASKQDIAITKTPRFSFYMKMLRFAENSHNKGVGYTIQLIAITLVSQLAVFIGYFSSND